MPDRLCILAPLLAGMLRGQTPAPRTVRFSDLPAGIARRFDADTFDSRIQGIERDTGRPECEGELAAFLKGPARPGDDPRMRYFAGLLAPPQRSVDFLEGEYRRVMGFLSDKDFLTVDGPYLIEI